MHRTSLIGVAVLAVLTHSSQRAAVAALPPEAALIDAKRAVWAWADEGSPSGRWTKLDGVTDAVAVAIWQGDVVVARFNGRVERWGGSGTTLQRLAGLEDVRRLSCGPSHCLALTVYGRVFAWGSNDAGQLGVPGTPSRPAEVAGLPEIVSVAAGENHSLALADDGRVFAWGSNVRSQLGSQPGEDSSAPRQVDAINSARAIAAGSGHSLAILDDRRIEAWGANESGQLGFTGGDVATPADVPGLAGADVAATAKQTYVTLADGSMRVFGETAADYAAGLTPEAAGAECAQTVAHAGSVVARASDGWVTLFREGGLLRFPPETFLDTPAPSAQRAPLAQAIQGAGRAAVVIGQPGPDRFDQALIQRLEALGFSVRTIEDRELSAAELAKESLVVFAPSVDAPDVDPAVAQAPTPFVSLDQFVVVRLGLANGRSTSRGSSPGSAVVVVDAKHPLGAGGEGAYPVVLEPEFMPWAVPNQHAQIVGITESGKPSVFGYEAGAQTPGGVAPARRAVVLLPPAPASHNTAAWTLFDASVRWSLGQESQQGTALRAARATIGAAQTQGLTGGSGIILLVVDNLTLGASEQVYMSRMLAMGFTVHTILASASQSGDATGKKLVFVTSGAPNGDVLEKFRLVTVPVVIQSSGIVDDMGMTDGTNESRGNDVASTDAVVVTPSHPIANGLTGTITVGTTASGQTWGIGNALTAQNVLRHTSNATHATVFGYERLAQMVGLGAPDRRLLFGLRGSVVQTFTTIGGDIFDRAIFWVTKTNVLPTVSAGPDQAATIDTNMTLSGTVMDDGLPIPPGTTTKLWSVVSQPPNSVVTFVGPINQPALTFRCNNIGALVLRLSASDDSGSTWVTDDVTITVFGEEANQAPTANAGNDLVWDLASPPLALLGSVTDEGLPNPPQRTTGKWTKVSGPGSVSFFPYNQPATTATFSLKGIYVLRLTANDCDPTVYPAACPTGGLSAFDDVVVNVQSSVLLVVGNPAALTATDIYLKSRMQALGFPIVLQASATSASSQANGRLFVWVSKSSPNGDILAKFKNTLVPVAVQKSGILDDMKMTSTANLGSAQSQTQGVLPSPANHAISAGITGTVTINSTPNQFDWGTPSANGAKVITLTTNANRATLFAYEKNVTMDGIFVSPERRVLFGMDVLQTTPTLDTQRILDRTLLWLGRTNAAPLPYAGPDQTPTLSGPSVQINLAGWVVDDLLPNPPAATTKLWSSLSGPAPVTFGNTANPVTTATFTAAGDYVLKLRADDGALSLYDTAVISVLTPGANQPPTVAAGPDRTVNIPFGLGLTAVAGDDGLPGALGYQWSVVSGPGTVTFSPPSANTKTVIASFSAAGVYVLRVTVNDGSASASDDVVVTAVTAPTALLIVGSTPLGAQDAAIKTRLEQFGLSVTSETSLETQGSSANGRAVVVISDTSNSTDLQAKFKNTTTPVLCQEPFVYDDMKMTGATGADNGNVTGSTATMIAVGHSLAARLSGTVTTHSAAVPQAFGVPAATAIKVAVAPSDSTKALAFAYPEGVVTFGGFAIPGRRVGLFSALNFYTPEGFALFDAALRWLTERRAPALLVTGSTSLTTSDQLLLDRLLVQGYATTVESSNGVVSTDALGKTLVLIAPSANATTLGTKLRDVAVPVLVTGSGVFPNMGLTGTQSGVDFGTAASQTAVAIVQPLHALAAHLSGTPTVVNPSDTFSWGIPAATAEIVATRADDANKATTFGYEAGDSMVGVSALERRVALWLGPNSPERLTSSGSALLDAAINWLLASDGDQDGLGFLEEFRAGTDPADPDSNDDGVLDGAAVDGDISATASDMDGDGLTNAQEAAKGTDPFLFDTDGDGVGDGTDCFPLDKTRSACPPPVPGDTIPPGITLAEPINHTLVSSVCTPNPCP